MGIFDKKEEDVTLDGLKSFMPPWVQKKAANYLIKLAQKGHEGKKIKSIGLSLIRDAEIVKGEEMDFSKVFKIEIYHYDINIEFAKLKEVNLRQFNEIAELRKRLNNLKDKI